MIRVGSSPTFPTRERVWWRAVERSILRRLDRELMRKWLSGRASPCQGEGREFESRLPLHKVARADASSSLEGRKLLGLFDQRAQLHYVDRPVETARVKIRRLKSVKVTTAEVEGSQVVLDMEIEPERVDKAMERAYRRIVVQGERPGFPSRQGSSSDDRAGGRSERP